MINFFRWSETGPVTKDRIMKRSEQDITSLSKEIVPIINAVKKDGDAAVIRYTAQFTGAKMDKLSLKVSPEEFDEAEAALDDGIKQAIDACIATVRRYHETQLKRIETEWITEVMPGIWAGERATPIDSVGLYVPGGRGRFPSVAYMLAIPARLVGVRNIVMTTPPQKDGKVDPATLYAARQCGVSNVFRAGGVQAIAAFAYGTETIPSVLKVLGPGSIYVAAAKRALADEIDPGMPAGPSEVLVLADENAHPYNVAIDLLNEAEHGADSAALLVTPSESLAKDVQGQLEELIEKLPQDRRAICKKVFSIYGGLIVTEDMDEAIAFSNEYAPEHLLLRVKDVDDVYPRLLNAGEILIGDLTPSTFANYGLGVNHVLPTGGRAHTASATSVWDFLKKTSIGMVEKPNKALEAHCVTLARYEGFPAHCQAVEGREQTVKKVKVPVALKKSARKDKFKI